MQPAPGGRKGREKYRPNCGRFRRLQDRQHLKLSAPTFTPMHLFESDFTTPRAVPSLLRRTIRPLRPPDADDLG